MLTMYIDEIDYDGKEKAESLQSKKKFASSQIRTDYLLNGHTRIYNTITTTPTNLSKHSIMGLYSNLQIVRTPNWLNRCSTVICPDSQQADLAFRPNFCPD
jgi:hypothetical protein